MRIPHLRNPEATEFYPIVREALAVWHSDASAVAQMNVGRSAGYPGTTVVEITDSPEFTSDWVGADESRFPARIRAAATALRDTGHLSSFRISHRDGELTIVALRSGSFSVTLPNGVILGVVPGVTKGTMFRDRRDLHDRNAHRGLVQGIAVAGSSVVLNGGYEDEDYGSTIVYTGEGGRDPNTGRQVADQELTRGNLALARNCDAGIPVRVVRGAEHRSPYSPVTGYRYDGLYRIDSYCSIVGAAGFRLWKYNLQSVDEEAQQDSKLTDAGVPTPRREDVVVSRIIRNSAVGEAVKEIHGNVCQICGTRVVTLGGSYSECCHIRPLGKPHDGPDVMENVLCLCPNCHVSFDRGALTISDSFVVSGCHETRLRIAPSHRINPAYIAYHRALFPQ